MCGISGFCDFNKRLGIEDLQKGNDALKHRGPDSTDLVLFQPDSAVIGLAHRRLSILDLSPLGNQPMYSDDRTVVVILNGEIYNFKEIREELIGLGQSFHTNSDTEVIIKAYQMFGIEAVHRFIGMFAFALYDMSREVLYLLRDRAGVKPLHYFQKNDCILFASELKALYTYPVFEKNINEEALALFFKYGYIRSPHTIFHNCYKVQPGHYLRIDLATKAVKDIKYYDVLDYYNKPKLKISEEEALEETEKLFISAFKYRMVSDVPVGVFLSGGYDSTVVSSILQANSTQKIKTFTIGFHEQKYNEAPFAKKIALYLGTDHNEYYCTIREAQEILPLMADIYDEPFGDSSGIPTTLVSRFARKQVTVALSADAGDEIFAGYNRYHQIFRLDNILRKTPRALRIAGSQMIRALPHRHLPGLRRMSQRFRRIEEALQSRDTNGLADVLSRHYSDRQLTSLINNYDPAVNLYGSLGKINNENDLINTLLALDYKTYMVDDILTKVDRATMTVGLEGREPLLDHRIIEFVSQLPSGLKYKAGTKKYLLKKITHKYVPPELLDRPKTGFGLPVNEWLKDDLKNYLYEYINEEELSRHGYINMKEAISLRDDFISGKNTNETQVWLLLIFQMWWKRWM